MCHTHVNLINVYKFSKAFRSLRSKKSKAHKHFLPSMPRIYGFDSMTKLNREKSLLWRHLLYVFVWNSILVDFILVSFFTIFILSGF